MLVFISSIIFYNLAYTTQAWIWNLKTSAMQANICKCTFKYNIQVYELAPPISYYLYEFSLPLPSISTKGELKF